MGYTDQITDFIAEVGSHCAGQSIGPSTLTNRVLGQTYALPRMLALAKSLDDRVDRLRDVMAGGKHLNPYPAETPPAKVGLTRSITLDLPVPPSTNDLHRTTHDHQRFRAKAYTEWRNAAAMQIVIARAGWVKKALPFDQPYVARIRISHSDKADVDNRIKALLDLLVEMQVTPDDKHMLSVSAGRSGNVDRSRVLITVRSIPIKL